MKYRRKTTIIEAKQFTDPEHPPKGVTLYSEPPNPPGPATGIGYVTTIHKQMTPVSLGDWIMPEPDGIHYYPCKPEVFAATYEPDQFTPTPPCNGPGVLEIGENEIGEVVINLPRDMTGHIVFSPRQARRLASLVNTHAEIAARNPLRWNPYNKVVQDHRDGTIDHDRTNQERGRRGLPVPWSPDLAEVEVGKPEVP